MKRIKLLFLIILLHGFTSNGFAQKIYETSQLKKGIYTSMIEVVNNAPKLPLKYKIQELQWFVKGYKNDTMFSYSILAENATATKLGAVFGFCDGTNVYVKQNGIPTIKNKKNSNYKGVNKLGFFVRIKHLNQLAYYVDYDFRDLKTPISGRAFDLETGEVTYMNEKSMKYLLRENKSLLAQFNAEPRKNRSDKKVLEQYYLHLVENKK